MELIKIVDEKKRNFYLNEAIISRWSVRELQRQKDSLLYERLILSKDKEEVLELSKKEHNVYRGKDLVKDPFVLEFLNINENHQYYDVKLIFCAIIVL